MRTKPGADFPALDDNAHCRTAGFVALVLLWFPFCLLAENTVDSEPAADVPAAAASADANGQIDEAQAQEREQAQKLRRAREDLESRTAAAARRLDAEQTRQQELSGLQGTLSNLGRRESFLGHETYWTQRERDSVSRDATDHSAMARRSGLDHQLYYYRNELDRTSTLRQNGTNQLNGLLLR